MSCVAEPEPAAPAGVDHVGPMCIRSVRRRHLNDLDLEIRIGELAALSPPGGSGKRSLVCDTLCAECLRRGAWTFSACARHCLARGDCPTVNPVDGLRPAIAIDQASAVKNHRDGQARRPSATTIQCGGGFTPATRMR